MEKKVPINPKIKLNPNQILTHVLSNGPNNQLVDFRHAIFWNIKLNRTAVFPIFFQHITNGQFSPISPEHRIDTTLLQEFDSIFIRYQKNEILMNQVS
jgi:hypothetical protein